MTEPSQYFKGRTVQEQMDEVIGYVDKRAEEVAAAKADAVLQPAEAAKTEAQAAAEAAEAAKNATIAALPEIRQDISSLKTEDVALDGRLNTVELKVQTAEGNIVTIQGQIVALQNVQGEYLKKAGAEQTVTSQIMVPTTATGLRDTQIANGTRIQNDLDAYEPMIRNTGNQKISGVKDFVNGVDGQDYYHPCHVDNSADNIWKDIISFDYKDNRSCIFDIISMFNNNDVQNARIKIRMQGGGVGIQVIESEGTTESMAKASNYVVTLTGTVVTIKAYKRRKYTDLSAKLLVWHNYQTIETPPKITYPNATCADPSTETFDSMAVGSIVAYRNVN